MSPPTYFPLRWESTGDQWWYASPIDWAAANGHYDLVRELLRLDGNHLIQLTSLRRTRRLETVWDDEEQFEEVAKCRSEVARKLLRECEMKKGKKSLVGGGYGGWVLYTAASAGDLSFVGELLERDPLLVFGEGEYGVTDVLYAAARSKKSEVFRMVLDYAAAPRLVDGDIPSAYKVEIMKRAVHAAARGGNLQLLKELLLVGDAHTHMLGYRDVEGATVLHAAAARGQLDVVKDLASNYPEVVNSRDNEGNTALHVAAQRGHLHVVEALIPCLMSARNNAGETFVHAVVSGFNTPGFRRVDRQMEVMKHALALENNTEIINARNNDGKTALHLAITGNIHSDLVQLLMSAGCIDVNIRDSEGMTPLDLLRQRPMSERQLITGGGMMLSYSARKAVASQMKRHRQSSPGSSFRISDAEIFLYTSTASPTPTAEGEMDSVLKRILHWPRKRDKVVDGVGSSGGVPVPLRQRFSSNKDKNKNKNKRPLSVSVSSSSSPTPKKKLMLMTATRAPASASASHRSRSSSFSKLSFSSHSSLNDTPKDKDKDDAAKSRHSFVNKMLCFGHNDPIDLQPYHIYERSVLSAA